MTVRKIPSLACKDELHNIPLFRDPPPTDSPSNDLSSSRDLPSPIGVPVRRSLALRLSTTTNQYMAAGQGFPRTETTSASEVMKLVGRFDMDAGRTSTLETVQGKLGVLSASEAINLVGLFDEDAGRTRALETVQGKLGVLSASEAINLVGLFDMDAGRTSTLKAVQGKLGPFSASEVIDLVRLFDMDAGRTSTLKAVQGKLGPFSTSEQTQLVGLFDMDSGRNYAHNIVRSRSCTDRMNLLHLTGRSNVTQPTFRNYSVGGDSVQFDVS